MLVYANAATSLPQSLADPDADFLILTLTVVLGLCLLGFATGWLLGKLSGADTAQQTALMFGLGMNNNGTGLVLASMCLAGDTSIMLPILIYNLVQHVIAGNVAHFREVILASAK